APVLHQSYSLKLELAAEPPSLHSSSPVPLNTLSRCPRNRQQATHLRARIGKMFGLSAAVIDEVVRQSPYAPKPAGMVRNDRAEADGALYAVYWKKDVTATFGRFVEECVSVTPTMFTHPFIEGRFRCSGKGSA
ncbi:hypothetical protein ABLE91_15605, partial [Aquabacter sp. CN5-332]|uniref:hypothetical protein n=1 Tax=Aquabacter sp. CN5-332 TaxID=3156608 RepID=UPI0032B57D7A